MAHCPNLSNPKVKQEFEQLKELVGENFAYTIWDRNNGNPITQTPTGEESVLFEKLLEKVGSFEEAVRLKARIYASKGKAMWQDYNKEPSFTDSLFEDVNNMYQQAVVDRSKIERDEQTSLELFAGRKAIGCVGICNITARSSYNHLRDIGLDPFETNLNGTNISVTVPSPLDPHSYITHYIAAVAINGTVYVYDMPQSEYINQNAKEFLKGMADLNQSYMPRLIPLTIEDIKANYNLDDNKAALFLANVLDTALPYNEAQNLSYSNFKEYIETHIKEPGKYIDSLLTQIADASDIFFKDGVALDNLRDVRANEFKEIKGEYEVSREKAAKEIFDAIDKGLESEDFNKLVNFIRNKLKLKVRKYLPRKDREHLPEEVLRLILPTHSLSHLNLSTLNTTLSTLEPYLNSKTFIQDVWESYFKAYNKKSSALKSYRGLVKIKQTWDNFISHAKVVGLEEAKERFNFEDRLYIEKTLNQYSNVIKKIKTEEKRMGFLSTRNFVGKHMDLIRSSKQLDRAKTLLYYLELNDLNTDELYNVIKNELNRRSNYYKQEEPQYSKESPYEDISEEEGNKQVKVLKTALPFIEEVITDDTLPVLGQVEPGGKTITINPKKMKEDTLGHEYGHVLIDLMGGMDNAFIADGRKQLINSDTEKLVLKNYKELAGTEIFDKEVLATAIGAEVASIFRDREKRSKFANWLLNFYRKLKAMFGIEKNKAKLLAQQLTSNKKINVNKFTGKISDYIQKSKGDSPVAELQAIKNLDSKFEDPTDTKGYVFKPTGVEYERTSNVLARNKLGILPGTTSMALRTSSKLGTEIHNIAEKVLNNKKITIEDESVSIPKTAVNELVSIVSTLFKDYDVVTETKVGDDSIKVGGTIDVYGIHKGTGERVLFDFKTKRKYSSRTGKESGFKWIDSVYERGRNTDKDKYRAQLSMYQKMLYNTLGIKVDNRIIIPLTIDYEAQSDETVTVKTIELDEIGPMSLDYYEEVEGIYNRRKKELEAEERDITDEEVEDRSEDFVNKAFEDKVLSPLEQLREDAVNIIVSKLNRDRAKGRSNSVTSDLSNVLGYLGSPGVTEEEALMQFIDNAILEINASYNNYLQHSKKEKEGSKEAFPVALVQRWYTVFSAYGVLDKLVTAMHQGEFKSDSKKVQAKLDKLQEELQKAIYKRNVLRDQYERRGKNRLAEIYAKYSTYLRSVTLEEGARVYIEEHISEKANYTAKEWRARVEKGAEEYTNKKFPAMEASIKVFLENEMSEAEGGDITAWARWLESPINSPDPLIGAAMKKFSTVYNKIRMEAVEYNYDLTGILRELEAFLGYSPSSNLEEFYSFMLERNSSGELTGYILSNLDSSYFEAYKEMMKSLKGLPEADRAKIRYKWFDENAPLDFKAYNKSLFEFADKLVKEGKMTELQYSKFKAFNKRKTKGSLMRLFEDTELASTLDDWIRTNADSFRKPIDKWKNKEWETLQDILKDENDPRTKYYNFIVNTIQRRDARLPEKDRLGYQLPFANKSGRERILSGQSFKDVGEHKLKKYFAYQDEDIDRNTSTVLTDENDNPIKFLPTFYKRNDDDWTIKDQSFDLSTLYYDWNKMASHFENMNSILPDLALTRTIIANRKYAAKDANGEFLKKSMSYLGVQKVASKKEGANLLSQFDDYIEALVYGNKSLYIGEFDMGFVKVDKAKLLNTMGKYTSVTLLGMNVLQGINNVTYGELQNIIEAYSGEFYNLKDLHKASAFYYNNIMEAMGDIGNRRTESLLGQIIERFDTLNEYNGKDFRKNTKFSQMMGLSTLFFMSHTGEHFMQSRTLLAMLMKIKAYDSKGNLIGNMLEQYIKGEDGKLTINPKVDLLKSNWTTVDQDIFGEKVKAVLSGMHGEYSELGRIAIQKFAIGRLVLMFKKYLEPGIQRRWGKFKHNERLGSTTVGYNRVAAKVWFKFLKDFKKMGYETAALNYSKITPKEQYAIRKAIIEASFAILFSVLSTAAIAFKKAYPPDDDEYAYRTLLNTAAYAAMRTNKELQFYYFWNPVPAMTILRSPAASLSIVEGMWDLGSQLFTHPLEKYKTSNSPYEYKITKKLFKNFPITRSFHNLANVEDLVDILEINN